MGKSGALRKLTSISLFFTNIHCFVQRVCNIYKTFEKGVGLRLQIAQRHTKTAKYDELKSKNGAFCLRGLDNAAFIVICISFVCKFVDATLGIG